MLVDKVGSVITIGKGVIRPTSPDAHLHRCVLVAGYKDRLG